MTETAAVNVELSITLAPITYSDRDGAKWTVVEDEYEGQPVLKLSVVETSGPSQQVIFHKSDAEILVGLIENAIGK